MTDREKWLERLDEKSAGFAFLIEELRRDTINKVREEEEKRREDGRYSNRIWVLKDGMWWCFKQ